MTIIREPVKPRFIIEIKHLRCKENIPHIQEIEYDTWVVTIQPTDGESEVVELHSFDCEPEAVEYATKVATAIWGSYTEYEEVNEIV